MQFGKPRTDAAVDAIAERQVPTCIFAVNDQLVRIFKHAFVAIGRQIPHADLVARLDGRSEQVMVLRRGPPHMCQRRLPADDFADGVGDEARVLFQLISFILKAMQAINIARHGIACRVVTADDQQDEVTHIFQRGHVLHRRMDHPAD